MSYLSSEMQSYYTSRAPYYDAVYLQPERKTDIAFLKQYLPERLKGQNVLEVACGTGYWTQCIASEAATMIATDATEEPLSFARLRPNTSNVQFQQEDAYQLSAELGLFSAAFAGLWFSHIPVEARRDFLDTLHKRLLPGSRVIFIDNSEVQCNTYPIVETDGHGNTYQIRPLRDGSNHRVLKNFPTDNEMYSLVADHATKMEFRELENFWLFEYEINT